ncbi:MAG: RDD family protein [Clostridia bacterium]|nr:RDD family protein [Clostridia bacterium]
MFDLQKASILKRISALILDVILLCIVFAGAATLISRITGFDEVSEKYTAYYSELCEEYGIDPELTTDELDAMPADEYEAYKKACDDASRAFAANDEQMRNYSLMTILSVAIVTFGLLISYLILEFAIPMVFKNGQTVGKKVFGIGVMHSNSVRINGIALFIRTILGKYTIETMIPALIIVMALFSSTDIFRLLLIALIFVSNIVLFFATKAHTPIHDVLSKTVTVDLSSQMIFPSYDEMVKAKNAAHADEVRRDTDY